MALPLWKRQMKNNHQSLWIYCREKVKEKNEENNIHLFSSIFHFSILILGKNSNLYFSLLFYLLVHEIPRNFYYSWNRTYFCCVMCILDKVEINTILFSRMSLLYNTYICLPYRTELASDSEMPTDKKPHSTG